MVSQKLRIDAGVWPLRRKGVSVGMRGQSLEEHIWKHPLLGSTTATVPEIEKPSVEAAKFPTPVLSPYRTSGLMACRWPHKYGLAVSRDGAELKIMRWHVI